MKINNFIFYFFILVCFFSNSFGMKEDLIFENKNTLGASHFRSLVECVNSKDISEKERNHIIDMTMSNSIRYALYKAKYSVNGISDKLSDIPFVGGIVSKATDGIAAALFEFDSVIKDSNIIKDEAKNSFSNNLKNLPEDFKIEDMEKKGFRWFYKKINISELENINEEEKDSSKNRKKELFVEYLDSKNIKFEDFEKENTQDCFDILCFITDFAIKNKDFFLSTVDKGFNQKVKKALSWIRLYNKLCGWFHTKLSDPKSNIESEIRSNLYPDEQVKK